MTSVKEAL